MQNLKNKIALITGAGAGIGHAICKALANEGAIVIAVAKNEDNLKILQFELNDEKHQFWNIDLSTENGCNSLAENLEAYGFPHIVVCNLQVHIEKQRIINTTQKTIAENFTVNINHLFTIMQNTLLFQRRENFGRWIGISSFAAHTGLPGQTIYNAQKAAMESVFFNLAVEEGKYQITSNIVSPGFIETPSVKQRISKEIIEKVSAFNVLKRAGTPEEVAAAVKFLTLPEASYITGINLPVCGGAQLAWHLS